MERPAWGPGSHRLYDVRLGKMERWLFLRAPSPENTFGYVIDDPDRSVREGLRRAAVKLDRVGLVERLPFEVYVRARDARREGLQFSHGRFWMHIEATRAHAVRRNVVWKSPFGFAIWQHYKDQLESGARIRWDSATVNRLFDHTSNKFTAWRPVWRDSIETQEDAERDAVLFADRSSRVQEVVPVEVTTKENRKRWQLSIAAAQRREDTVDPGALWELAFRLYATEDLDVLDAEAARGRPTNRAEQFRRQPRLELG